MISKLYCMFWVKGTQSGISNDPTCKDCNVRFKIIIKNKILMLIIKKTDYFQLWLQMCISTAGKR